MKFDLINRIAYQIYPISVGEISSNLLKMYTFLTPVKLILLFVLFI